MTAPLVEACVWYLASAACGCSGGVMSLYFLQLHANLNPSDTALQLLHTKNAKQNL